MKYKAIVRNSERYREYIIEQVEEFDVAMIEFEDKDVSDVIDIVTDTNKDFAERRPDDYGFGCLGDDEYRYVFRLRDCDRKRMKKLKSKLFYNHFNQFKEESKYLERVKERIKTFDKNEIIEDEKVKNNGFKKFNYICKEDDRIVPFRLKTSRLKKKQPLVVSFHGGGCLGHDNKRPLLEFKWLNFKLLTKKCNILVPQADFLSNKDEDGIVNHIVTVKKLIDELILKYPIDIDRIYLVGTSFGGACVWYSLYHFPNFFGAGIPVMGSLFDVDKKDFSPERLLNENIWVAHSANDRNVLIREDDLLVAKLRELGMEIRYTRWNRLGHGMSNLFYVKESWAKWLFDQKRKGDN